MKFYSSILRCSRRILPIAGFVVFATNTMAQAVPVTHSATLEFSFGNRAARKGLRSVQLVAASQGMQVSAPVGKGLENDDRAGSLSSIHAGAGDIDGLTATVTWPEPSAPERKLAYHKDGYALNGDAMWGYLMANGSPGQSARLKLDPWKQPDAAILTVRLNEAGTEGFSIGLAQLIAAGAMWLPEQDVYITLADKPVSFPQHLSRLTGKRTLDRVAAAPDASLEQFKQLWPDFGNPLAWDVTWQTTYMGTRGHLTVTAPAHGSVYKFAVDRWANVRPDFASPYKFRQDLSWPGSTWARQKIDSGLPVIITTLTKNRQAFNIEQFAGAIGDTSDYKRGETPGVLFTSISISGNDGPVDFELQLNNDFTNGEPELVNEAGQFIVKDKTNGYLLLSIVANPGFGISLNTATGGAHTISLKISGVLNSGTSQQVDIKLPSPAISPDRRSAFDAMTVTASKERTTRYWTNWLNRGAQFTVPEATVNNLYRASLWHALVLPRHTTDSNGQAHMDLPYANTAYGQKNADWPVNQAVYVDYMLYGLRAYENVAEDELAAMFRSQQQPDGRIGGFANWGVYSPGHLYAIAQNFLLSRNRAEFERLLPAALKTLDWCLAQIKNARGTGKSGLILAPLNDLTHDEREWAFTQAYFAGGLQRFAEALRAYNHPRYREVQEVAAAMKRDIVEEFSKASVRSPVVQLEDGSWGNFVPTDAMSPRRMMDLWYPSDVDCGPLHLSRLGVLEPFSWLTTAMLHDNEDNLFLKNLGAANEPVYVQQANTYLLRDEPKAVIRAFYSLMACGFSHEQLTSLEHRWAWGQYYGPPSTDGAWFELYRRMLLNERGTDTLMIGQATPRKWLEAGKQISVSGAPTYFGPVTFTINGLDNRQSINAVVQLSGRNLPGQLVLRLRHPLEKAMRSVTVNGKSWKTFNPKLETITIAAPRAEQYVIRVNY